DDDQPRPWELLVHEGHGAQEIGESLASLVEAANEENPWRPVPRPGERLDVRVIGLEVDAVRNDVVGAVEILEHEVARRLGDGNAAIKPAQDEGKIGFEGGVP